MLVIVGTVRLPPQNMAEAQDIMETMIMATRAEDGCERYHFAEDVLDAGLIHVSEIWRDNESLGRHFSSGHVARWRDACLELGLTGRDLRLYEVEKSQPL